MRMICCMRYFGIDTCHLSYIRVRAKPSSWCFQEILLLNVKNTSAKKELFPWPKTWYFGNEKLIIEEFQIKVNWIFDKFSTKKSDIWTFPILCVTFAWFPETVSYVVSTSHEKFSMTCSYFPVLPVFIV